MSEPTVSLPVGTIAPEVLAKVFWNMDSTEQARFFNQLGVEALSTPAPFSREVGSWFALDFQMFNAAVDHPALPLGRRVMGIIGTAADPAHAMPYDRTAVRERELRLVKGGAK